MTGRTPDDEPMTPDEANRLRTLEIQFAQHQTECRGNHEAISGRFDRIERLLKESAEWMVGQREAAERGIKNKLARQTLLQILGYVAMIAIVVFSGPKSEVLLKLVSGLLGG